MAELVKICDAAGRVRGSGFVADDRGTVVTSHEAVDGLTRVLLHGPGRTWLADAADVTALPGLALALVRTDGLGMRPLPVAMREVIDPGTYVRLPARGWRQARVLGAPRSRTPRWSWRSARTAGTPCCWAGRPAGARCSTPEPERCSRSWAPLCRRNTARRPSRWPCAPPPRPTRAAPWPPCWNATPPPCPATAPT